MLPGVGVGRVFGNAFNRAHHHALRLVEMPHALGAFTGVYFINFFTHADRAVRALGLAHVAVNAFIGDD
ncbi:translation-associated GTPase [Limnobacter sp. MED105]|nr:translation-associated GTPase [Limnobacter sp. MED105]